MESKRNFTNCFFAILVVGTFTFSSCEAYRFNVGGKEGLWVLKPSENYNHWAERMRFQVNDTLYFKYKKGSDSVLVVTKDDYFSCNNKIPIQSLTGGESVFIFNHSGPYFFITGNTDNCNKGQKLIVVVMAVRNKSQHHEAPPSPSPVSSPPAYSPQPSTYSPPTSPASPPSSVPPSPRSSQSPMQPPEPSDTPSDFGAPAQAPMNSGSSGLGCNIGLVLGFSVGVSLVLGSFIGLA